MPGAEVGRIFRLFLVAAVVGGAAYGFTLLPSGIWNRGKNSLYREVSVTRGGVTEVVNSTGKVQPVQSVQIGSFVSGPIARTEVDFNSRVNSSSSL